MRPSTRSTSLPACSLRAVSCIALVHGSALLAVVGGRAENPEIRGKGPDGVSLVRVGHGPPAGILPAGCAVNADAGR